MRRQRLLRAEGRYSETKYTTILLASTLRRKLFTLYGMGTYTIHTETLMYIYSLSKARIETGVGAKHFLQFRLAPSGGTFTISKIQSILRIRFYTFLHNMNWILPHLKHIYMYRAHDYNITGNANANTMT